MGMNQPTYHDPARASINLALPWHSVATEIADLNFDIVTGKLNQCMKSCNPARPWGPKDFFFGVGYHTHVPKPESLVIPSRPPPAERTAEDQPFFLVYKYPDDPHEPVNISSRSFSIYASQLVEHEALTRKTAAAFSNTLSTAEYIQLWPN